MVQAEVVFCGVVGVEVTPISACVPGQEFPRLLVSFVKSLNRPRSRQESAKLEWCSSKMKNLHVVAFRLSKETAGDCKKLTKETAEAEELGRLL